MVAITGTNGKSTTTDWIAHLAAPAGRGAEALGNLGRPFCQVADELEPDDLAVLEVSQLPAGDRRTTFAPRVGVVLNLAPDHLDRYPDLAAYYAAKRVLADRTDPDGHLRHLDRLPRGPWPGPRRRSACSSATLDAGAGVYWRDGDRCACRRRRTRRCRRTNWPCSRRPTCSTPWPPRRRRWPWD